MSTSRESNARTTHGAELPHAPDRTFAQLPDGEPSVASRPEQAARYAIETGCTNREAARQFGVSPNPVGIIRAVLTGAPQRPGRRAGQASTCSACGEAGHNARNGLCSGSFLAAEMVEDGDAGSISEAARALGISRQAVSQRIKGYR